MLENQIGKRYAEALSGSISDTGALEKALGHLQAFEDAMNTEKQLPRFFKHPSIATEKKKTVVQEICSRLQVEDNVSNMLVLLNERNIMLRIGDQVTDDTIRNRLDMLKRTIEKEEVA